MSIAEGYVVTLGCDFHPKNLECPHDHFYGTTREQAFKAVRESGWHVYISQQKAKCRRCVNIKGSK